MICDLNTPFAHVCIGKGKKYGEVLFYLALSACAAAKLGHVVSRTPFFANAWLGPPSEKGRRTCAAEVYLADPSYQARSIGGSVVTSMTGA
jgi:hypothetical protein